MSDKHRQRARIEKVRALLTMTVENGCTEAEAMTAAAMAARLMEEYDLATTEVRSVQDERIARQSAPFQSTENRRQMHPAGIYVAVAVGEFLDCKCWRNHTDIIFFGVKHDVDLAHINAGDDPLRNGPRARGVPEEGQNKRGASTLGCSELRKGHVRSHPRAFAGTQGSAHR